MSKPTGTLGDLLAAKGLQVRATPEPPPATPTSPAAGDRLDTGGARKIVIRKERKGRGGKTATVIEGFRLPPSGLDRIARDLKKALGCGATVEDDRIVVQGDLAPRVEAWLRSRGVEKVVLGT